MSEKLDKQKIRRIALYARVSTQRQATNESIQNQLSELRRFAKFNKYKIVKEYVDKGYSGMRADRPSYRALMRDSAEGKFDAVVCWKFDRFARDVQELLSALKQFKECGISFISITECIDTGTNVGELVMTLLGGIAKFERNIIAERIQAGMERKRNEGKQFGRKPKLKDPTRVYKLRAKNKTLDEIAEKLNLTKARVSQLLQEKVRVEKLLKLKRSDEEIARELGIQLKRVRKIKQYIFSEQVKQPQENLTLLYN